MTKSRQKASKQKNNRIGNRKSKIQKAKFDPRAQILSKQLKDFGKVGGIIDKRVGVQGSSTNSEDAALRRHIIEKLRQMETFGTVPAGEDDPLIRAALSGKKVGQHASFDDELGGLSAEVVESELFAGGLLTPADANSAALRQNKHDALLDKIAQTKEERLKRVEENEAQRKKVKDVDSEWTDKVRFMLAKLANLKPKNTKAAFKMEKGRNEVMGLLTQLTSASTKSIPPIGAKVETEDIKADRLLANLETIVSRKMEASAATTVEGSDKTSISYPAGELPQRTEDVLLRLLCRIGTYESATVARVVDELQRLSRIPSSMTLAQALRGLLLVQILFTDVIQRKVNQGSNDIKSTAAVQFGNKFANSDRLNGCFVPEVPRFLMRLLSTACVEGGLLHLTEDASSLEEIALGEKSSVFTAEEESLIRLGCLDRCLGLTNSLLDIYSAHFPAPPLLQMFAIAPLTSLPTDHLPVGIELKAKQLTDQLTSLLAKPRPQDLVVKDKISLLLANPDAAPQALQKLGIVPQLEPQFDEKLDARRPKKKKSATTELRQKLTKERRGVARELRRDAQFLADYDLKRTKASDDLRRRKTQAIVASMRCID